MTEHDHQVALFQWATLLSRKYPELAYLYAIPLGGYRHKQTAVRLKAEGVKAGYPDVALDVARMGFHGLRIEFKVGRNTLTPAQQDWFQFLTTQGYLVRVCHSWHEASELITQYLDQTLPCRDYPPALIFPSQGDD